MNSFWQFLLYTIKAADINSGLTLVGDGLIKRFQK